MHRLVRSIRLAGIIAAACLTLLSGLALVWFFVQPETLPLLSTWQLAAILGAFVLPGLCLGAWQADRRIAAHAPRARVRPVKQIATPPVSRPSPVQVPETMVGPAIVVRPAPGAPIARLSPAGRSVHADRSVHRHRRSARV